MESFVPDLTSSAPLDIELDITSKCQLDCSYCSAAPLMGNEIPTALAIDLIEEMGRLGVFSLLLSGGEPTIHHGIMEVIACASENIPILTVNTNGIRLAKVAFAKRFHASAPGALVSISLDATDVALNNKHRGSGGDQAKSAIENCLSLGQRVNISCVLTEDNIDHADKLLEAYAGPVNKFSFFPRVPRDNAEIVPIEKALVFWKKFHEFSEYVNSRYPSEGQISVMLPFTKLQPSERGALFEHVKGCCCAYTRIYISSDLRVYPCYYSAGSDNYIGSCKTSTISDLWKNDTVGAIRQRARSECLCGVSFYSDKIPYRFLSADHIKLKNFAEKLKQESGEKWRAILWKG